MSTTAKTRIEPGHTSIDRATPRKTKTGYQLDWSVRLHDGRIIQRRSKAKTKGEVRARARRKADELLSTTSTEWTPRTPMNVYIEKVTRPKIEESSQLKDLSKRRYLASLNLVAAELKGYSVFDAMQFRVLERTLQATARTSGQRIECENHTFYLHCRRAGPRRSHFRQPHTRGKARHPSTGEGRRRWS